MGEYFKDKDVFFCALGTTRRMAGSAVSTVFCTAIVTTLSFQGIYNLHAFTFVHVYVFNFRKLSGESTEIMS